MSLFGRSPHALVLHLRRRGAEENGTVILLVAAMLTGILAFGAYTIDIGSGRQAQTKAQSTADAAATAAAAAVAGGASTTAAMSTATTVAQQNGATAANIAVTYIASGATGRPSFQVRIRGDDATSVGNESGRSSIPVAASATAAVKVTTTTSAQTITNTTTSTTTNSSCASAGSNCMAIFAAQTGCSNTGVTLGGGTTVAGGVWSNSSLNIGGGGSSFQALTYGTGCTVTPAAGIDPGQNYQSNTFHNGLPQAQTPLTDFPINYLADFPTCSGTGCTGVCATNNNTSAAGTVSSCATSLKTPSFCTQASTKSSWSVDTYTAPYTLITGQVYCAVGSGTPSNPTTWNGSLTVAGGSSSMRSSFVAGSITVSGGTTLAACGYNLPYFSSSTCSAPAPSTPDYPLFATSGTINASQGGNGLTGDWYAPEGAISVGGGTSFVGFLEAQTVNLSSGGITGDGPADDGSSVGSTSTSYSTSTVVTTTSGTQTQGSSLIG